MNAVIYARYSSEKQTEQSIEGQIHACEDYAKKNNLTIVDTYIDRAKTGKNDSREAFRQMINDSSLKKFSVILVYTLDRFSRNRYDSAVYKAILKKNFVKLISTTQSIPDTPEGIIMESLLEGMAEYYSAELARKMKRGRQESIAKGQFVGGGIPYGYNIVNKKFLINEQEAEVIRIIFKCFTEGMPKSEITRYLKKNNLYTRQGKTFGDSTLTRILTNEIYIGTLKSGEFVNEGAVPKIVDEDTFKEANAMLENKKVPKTKSPANFILTGKIFCGECGEPIVGESGTSKTGKTYYYYNCLGRKKGKGCQLSKIPKDKLENHIYLQAKAKLTDEDFLNTLVNTIVETLKENNKVEEIAQIKKEIASINKKLTNIFNAVQNGYFNEKLNEQNDSLIEKKAELERDLFVLEHDPLQNKTPEDIKNFIVNSYANAEFETIINGLVYQIYVYKDYIGIIFNLQDKKDGNKKLFEHSYLNSQIKSSNNHRVVAYPGLEPGTP